MPLSGVATATAGKRRIAAKLELLVASMTARRVTVSQSPAAMTRSITSPSESGRSPELIIVLERRRLAVVMKSNQLRSVAVEAKNIAWLTAD